MDEITFSIIKPDAVAAGSTGRILDAMTGAGFRIVAMRMVRMTPDDAGRFYAVHRGKPFFDSLTAFMSSGPSVVLALRGDDAVSSLRRLAGETDPARAAAGTLRRRFGHDLTRNALHAADSPESVRREIGLFFVAADMVG